MLKKLFSIFSKKKKRNFPEKNQSEFSEEVGAISIQKVGSTPDKIGDEAFIIDFISIRESGETIKKAEVIFPANNQYIIINGEKTYFDAYYVRDEGMSSDNLYHIIATPDFKFWILPKDYKRFISIANYRHDMLIENRRKRDEFIKADINNSFEYDPIDEDIYNCFIANKTGMCDAIGTWEQFRKVEEQMAKICEENNGKYFKSQAKTAKFAIIFDYSRRTYSNITSLREKGYKVTTFEATLESFGLSDMWNIKSIKKMENEHKKFMNERYGD